MKKKRKYKLGIWAEEPPIEIRAGDRLIYQDITARKCTKRKVYIAGKITGDPEYREKFKYAEAKLQADGCIVLNPAVLPDGMEPKDYMRICFAMMEVADEAHFLPDWKDSADATLEYQWCAYAGKTMCFDYYGDETPHPSSASREIGGCHLPQRGRLWQVLKSVVGEKQHG